MEKKTYEKPEMEVVMLENDAILTSGGDDTTCTSQFSSENLNVSC